MGAKCIRADEPEETSQSSSSTGSPIGTGRPEQICPAEEVSKALSCRCVRTVAVDPVESHSGLAKAKANPKRAGRDKLPIAEEPFAEVDVSLGPDVAGKLGIVRLLLPELRLSEAMSKELVGEWSRIVPEPVTLHIYNIGKNTVGKAVNRLLRTMGTGAFHCGVEVYGREWSYSDTEDGGGFGIFCSAPRRCVGHTYSESIQMGRTSVTPLEVLELIKLLNGYWPVSAYNTLTHNCCHFCNEFCQRLQVSSVPDWVMSLAGAGAAIAASGDTTCCREVAREMVGPVVASRVCCASGERLGYIASYHL